MWREATAGISSGSWSIRWSILSGRGCWRKKWSSRASLSFASRRERSTYSTIVTKIKCSTRSIGIAVAEAKSPDGHLANFADWYRHLRQETEDYEYIRDLSEVIEGFVTMRLEDAGERRREIKVKMATQTN